MKHLVLLMALCAQAPIQASANPPERLSLEAARAKVASYVRQQKPGVQLGDDFTVVDLTTTALWDKLKVQILKVNDGPVERGESFLLRGDELTPIGCAFGGDGVTSVVAADLVGDQRPLLIYAFAWGSGIHRSEIGILDLDGKAPKELRLEPVNYSRDDYVLRNAPDGGVEVLQGKTLTGHVTAARKRGVLEATLKLSKK